MENPNILECAVCLQTCVHPAQLPCGHIFCFLCVKGVANQSKRCAMCRQEIPCDFLENPKLIQLLEEEHVDTTEPEDGFQWFYEGRNGWWKYDVRTNKELDVAFQSGVRTCELLIAGFLYIIDFDAMLQLRRNDPSRRRRIKRDAIATPVKGVAGIKYNSQQSNVRVKTPEIEDVNLVPPSNTPASLSHSGTATPNISESLNRTIDQITSLSLQDVVELVAESRLTLDNRESVVESTSTRHEDRHALPTGHEGDRGINTDDETGTVL